ncbi:MAG TPA: carbamoyltransferase HypF [Octadecabacter sp.]|nr:carbamoyltransferase HypF [Octadecabacter sp.]
MCEFAEQSWEIRVRGLVQGVGFRPAVWRIATAKGLAGEVLNDGEGVLIRLGCSPAARDAFLENLKRDAPPLSRIDAIEVAEQTPTPAFGGFQIIASTSGSVRTGIVPDAATCPDCLADIMDPKNRRFGYPFTNCTNCGPRLSIMCAIPYDRVNTAMSIFEMCPDCTGEYEDPADRRFHAQPNACPICGPQLALVDGDREALPGEPLEAAADMLRLGKIVAIKGLGGFQLACDATNANAVTELRRRKHRAAKPFAMMGRDLEQIGCFASVDQTATDLLTSPPAPIALLPAIETDNGLAAEVAPDQTRLGFMLPNTPLHQLLLQRLDVPLVMTSGNRSGEPQVSDNEEALDQLAGIADAWLIHDREIVNRLDDSVVQFVADSPQVLRRARGYAPEPLQLHQGFAEADPILACGGDLKNTFCLLKDGQAIVSPHVGDMQNTRTNREFQRSLSLFSDTHDFRPQTVAVDAHPGYFSSRLGREKAASDAVPLVEVQHHHAHVAAVMAEHGFGPETPPVLGVVLDGLGYGDDGTIWGGEFLLADFHGYERLAHFAPVAMPGGDKANQQPWRSLWAHLSEVFGPDALAEIESQYGALPILDALAAKPIDMLSQMIARSVNTPSASSAGRLFDAIAAALGLCFDEIRFEGQAAMALQSLAESAPDECAEYPVDTGKVIGWTGMWHGFLTDLGAAVPRSVIAARAHNTIVSAICTCVSDLPRTHDISTVVLSGGVFQNRLLLEETQTRLKALGKEVFAPSAFPANDGGLSLGQAAIAAVGLR